MKSEEELLIQKAKSGDEEAFRALYDTYITPIYRFVFLKVQQRQDAEDITQHTFVSAWENIRTYEHRGFPFSSWLYRIAGNAVIDHFRTHRHTIDVDAVPEDFLAHHDETESELDTSIEMKEVRIALQSLEPDQQNVIIMKFVEDLSNKEIAAALQKSEGAIRVIQHRALKQVKTIIDARRNNHTIKEI